MEAKGSMRRMVLVGLLWCCWCPNLEASAGADSSLVVSRIVVTGNEMTKDYVILREMSLKVGDPLTAEALENDQKRIYSLELFNKVDVDYEAEGHEASVYVRVSERWYIFPFPVLGFKYRDIKKLYYGAGLIHENFRGRNEKIFGSFAFGFDRWVSLTYQNPKLTDGDDIFFKGYVSYSHVQNQNIRQGLYDQQVFSASAYLGKRFGLYNTLLGYIGYEDWLVSEPGEGRTASPTGRDRYPSLGLQYTIDARDIREYPTAGHLILLSATKIGLGHDVDLLRYQADVRGYQPLGDGIALCGRVHGSFVSGGIVPAYLHAYFGYRERLRGYFDTVLEGEDIVGCNAELRVPILTPRYHTVSASFLPPEFRVWRYGLYAGVFADAGTIWYRTTPFVKAPWYSGCGAGLHFLLPYSIVIRTEYAMSQRGKGQFVLDFDASF
jgi:outer membrane protein insertion porin family